MVEKGDQETIGEGSNFRFCFTEYGCSQGSEVTPVKQGGPRRRQSAYLSDRNHNPRANLLRVTPETVHFKNVISAAVFSQRFLSISSSILTFILFDWR